MQGIIVVGDPTTGGGVVITGDPHWQVRDRPVTRVGDSATCRVKGHPSVVVVVEGHPHIQSDGRAIALHGARLSCGCKVLASTNHEFAGWVEEPGAPHLNPARASNARNRDAFDQRFRLIDSLTGVPLEDQPYRLTIGGTIYEGRTDAEGRTETVPTGPAPRQIDYEILGILVDE